MDFFKSIIEESPEEGKYIAKVLKFRKDIEKQNDYLYKTFITPLDWERLFRSLVCKWLDNLSQQVTEIEPVDLKQRILFEISFVDWIRGDSKAEIYFTIKDQESLNAWLELSTEQKKQYLYDQLYQHLYVIIGCNPYTAIIRFKLNENRYLLLGIISFEYGASLEQSHIYIPLELNQIFSQDDVEKRLIDFWT